MEYVLLDVDARKAMLEKLLLGYEAQHFEQQVTLELLCASGDESDEVRATVWAIREALETLDNAHEGVSNKLKEL